MTEATGFAPPTGDVTYTEEPYGLRHRPLSSAMDDGFQAALDQLLPDELVYHMLVCDDGVSRPVLISMPETFDEILGFVSEQSPEHHLVAGIPKVIGNFRTVMRDGKPVQVNATTGEPVPTFAERQPCKPRPTKPLTGMRTPPNRTLKIGAAAVRAAVRHIGTLTD